MVVGEPLNSRSEGVDDVDQAVDESTPATDR
jgi:hypothetical protein